MHLFFDVLQRSLAAARWTGPEVTVRFVVGVLRPEHVTLRLSGSGSRLVVGESFYEPELFIYCDDGQLDALVQHGFSPRPLRFDGRRELFDELAQRLKPKQNMLQVRGGQG